MFTCRADRCALSYCHLCPLCRLCRVLRSTRTCAAVFRVRTLRLCARILNSTLTLRPRLREPERTHSFRMSDCRCRTALPFPLPFLCSLRFHLCVASRRVGLQARRAALPNPIFACLRVFGMLMSNDLLVVAAAPLLRFHRVSIAAWRGSAATGSVQRTRSV